MASSLQGLSQMAIVLPQAIAPASVTSLFAASIKSHIMGGNIIYVVLFAFSVLHISLNMMSFSCELTSLVGSVCRGCA